MQIDSGTVRAILEQAALAPSIDNCQPWRFTLQQEEIAVFLDKSRAEFFGDYGFMASYATIGALVENMTIAAAYHHLQSEVAAFPMSGSDEPVARVRFTAGPAGSAELYSALGLRCTNRRSYRTESIPAAVVQRLNAAVGEGTRLMIVDDATTITKISRLAATIDRVIFEHRLLHENLFRWMRWNRTQVKTTCDGMGIDVLELAAVDRIAFRTISSWPLLNFLNRFGASRLIASKNSALLRKSPAIALLVMNGSSRENYFNGGRSMERFWLQATNEGLALHPWGGIPFLLARIKQAGGDGFSQEHAERLRAVERELGQLAGMQAEDTLLILFRLGYARPPSARTLRRSLSDTLTDKTCHERR